MKPEDKAKVQQALEVIETPIHEQQFMAKQKAIAALRRLLEQPEPVQEPVALIRSSTEHIAALVQERDELQKQVWMYEKHGGAWVGLTDEDIAEAGQLNVEGPRMLPYAFARAIEAKLKEKNT
jgi:hypothetical protein